MSSYDEKTQAFEGAGETLAEALDDAATEAVRGGIPLETELQVARHIVKISNPRVTEHKVVLITKP